MTCATPTASLLAAAGVDLVTIKSAMDHSALAITGRHLPRPTSERAGVGVHAGF